MRFPTFYHLLYEQFQMIYFWILFVKGPDSSENEFKRQTPTIKRARDPAASSRGSGKIEIMADIRKDIHAMVPQKREKAAQNAEDVSAIL
jgi:hypothetical protein